jgi:hypothetical protein
VKRLLVAITAVALAGTLQLAKAQEAVPTAVMPEVRADVVTGHRPALQLGAGVQIPFGYYVRLGLDGAAGVRVDDVTPRADARIDVLTRFLLDPFRQSRYGLSVGGGVGLRAEPHDRVRPLLLVAIDLEGRRGVSGWAPAVQVGLGGGARLGLVLRRGVPNAR